MKLRTALPVLCILFAVLSPEAAAQFNRTAVSLNGNDANLCTVASPCRSFARALSQTNPGGEVIALDSGGYGPFTVDRSASIMAAPGVYAGITATSGDGILVNAGAGAKVVIRGLHLNKLGTGGAGIAATGSGEKVHVENCVIDGFSNGILASLNVRVSHTTIRRSAIGIYFANAAAAVKGTINGVEVRDMTAQGIVSDINAIVTVRDSIVADCGSTGFYANSGGQLTIENSLAMNNIIGVRVEGTGSVVRVSNTMATGNDFGFQHFGDCCTFVSWGNNKVQGNATNKSGTIAVVAQD